MKIKINSINHLYGNFTNPEKPNGIVQDSKKLDEISKFAYTDLVFKARTLTLVKPELNTPLMEKLGQKVLFYLEKFPELSKTSKPFLLNFENKQLEFTVDKTKKALSEINIKLYENNKTFTSGIKMCIDKNGQMVEGICYDNDRMCILFERRKRNIRRIQYGNTFYKPISEDSITWQQLVTNKFDHAYYSAAKNMNFRDSEFQSFFMEMTKRDTSFFVK